MRRRPVWIKPGLERSRGFIRGCLALIDAKLYELTGNR